MLNIKEIIKGLMEIILKNKRSVFCCVFSILLLLSSCNSKNKMDHKKIKNQTNKVADITQTVILTSGTMGELNAQRVGCDDIGIDKYVLPNGETKKGLTAMLSIGSNNWVTVGIGSELDVDGSNWRVVKIEGKDVYLEEVALIK
jgi:hypothetical protein